MNFVYVDESGNTGLNLNDSQQPVFVLAAIIVSETVWGSLERQFIDVCVRHFGEPLPDPFEVQAKDLKAGRGVFSALDLPGQLAFRDAMLGLLVDNQIRLVYRRIIKGRFAAFIERNYGPGIRVNPYIMALPFVCMGVDHQLRRMGPHELGVLIFDEQKENLANAERSLRTLRLDSGSILKTANIVEKGFFIDSSKSFGLQLVDLAAYYIRKYEEATLGLRVSAVDQQTFPQLKALVAPESGTRAVDVLTWVEQHCIQKNSGRPM